MTRRLTIVLFVFAVLLIGAGCNNGARPDGAEPSQTQNTSTQKIVKKPAEPSFTEQAYAFCEQQGNTVVIYFDSKTRQNNVFCVFPNQTACDIFAFAHGACAEENAIAFQKEDELLLQQIRTCTIDDPPVCGVDGHNYANHCIAELQQIGILHEGLCTPNEQSTPALVPKPSSPIALAPKKSIQTSTSGLTEEEEQEIIEEQNIAWLSFVMTLLQSEPPKTPRASLEECTYATSTVYYQSGGCATCLNTLYNAKGQIECYPNHEMGGACPAFFSLAARGPHCSLLWKDPR